MHFHFPFTVSQAIWILTLAAQLVLLVVLMGRDRVKRFPWFTASAALLALRLITEELLTGRLAIPVLQITMILLADLAGIVGFLVLIEIGRRAFAGLRLRTWLFGALAILVVGGVLLAIWGPWPTMKQIVGGAQPAPLVMLFNVLQLVAVKWQLLNELLAVELGLLVIFFGRRFNAGWRSHPQRIAIGLSTIALCAISVRGIGTLFEKTVMAHRETFDHIMSLWSKVLNANRLVGLAVAIWWIACLWIDEPDAAAPKALEAEQAAHEFGEA
jgi:hypothetical protein